jgi:hypothetical protein
MTGLPKVGIFHTWQAAKVWTLDLEACYQCSVNSRSHLTKTWLCPTSTADGPVKMSPLSTIFLFDIRPSISSINSQLNQFPMCAHHELSPTVTLADEPVFTQVSSPSTPSLGKYRKYALIIVFSFDQAEQEHLAFCCVSGDLCHFSAYRGFFFVLTSSTLGQTLTSRFSRFRVVGLAMYIAPNPIHRRRYSTRPNVTRCWCRTEQSWDVHPSCYQRHWYVNCMNQRK